jgi:hypothetical protein
VASILPAQSAAGEAAVELRAAERVISLPEDGKDLYLSILVHDHWREIPRERQMVAVFETNASLRALRQRCYFAIVTESDRTYREVFAGRILELPAIVLTKDDGTNLVKLSGANVPKDENALLGAFGMKTGTHPLRPWLDVPCPGPCPAPLPLEPKPSPKPDVAPVPDTVLPLPPVSPVDNPPAEPPFPWAALGLAVGGAAAVTAVIALRRRVRA